MLSVQQGLLREGDNNVRVVAQNGPSDVSLIDYVRVSYAHTFMADGALLRLTAPGHQAVSVGGFSSGAVRVFDVTEPDAAREVVGVVTKQENGYQGTIARHDR